MKPFRFRLEKVLNVRQKESKVAQQALVQAQFRSRAALSQREAAQAEREASEAELLSRRLHRMTALEWRMTAELHEAFIQEEEQAEAKLAAALHQEAVRREELAEAERREKVLDRLRERKAEEHRQAMEAWEQAQIDEMAQNIYRDGGDRR